MIRLLVAQALFAGLPLVDAERPRQDRAMHGVYALALGLGAWFERSQPGGLRASHHAKLQALALLAFGLESHASLEAQRPLAWTLANGVAVLTAAGFGLRALTQLETERKARQESHE